MLFENYLPTDIIPKISVKKNFHQKHYGQK